MAKDLAIVLNSGSINSAVATGLAAQKHRVILLHAEIAPQPGSRIRAVRFTERRCNRISFKLT